MTVEDRPDALAKPTNPLLRLLPYVHQLRDQEAGGALDGLLRVINEQVEVVHTDIDQLYANWFIETCADWVVPYIGELVGVTPASIPPGLTDEASREVRTGTPFLLPRRGVANAIRYRRRKGTIALLEELAADVAEWPARAVEAYRLLMVDQHTRHPHLDRARTVDLRIGDALDRLDGPFDEIAHLVDLRRPSSPRTRGRFGIPDVNLYVWRLKPRAVDLAPARNIDRARNRFTFDVLGVDQPLMIRPIAEPGTSHLGGELNVPAWIRRRAFDNHTGDYYGPSRSICLWRQARRTRRGRSALEPVPLTEVVAADLTDWRYLPRMGQVAVDPVLGRIAFPARASINTGLWVSYRRGFSADMGGGDYVRPLRPVGTRRRYSVGRGGDYPTIARAYDRWQADRDADPPQRDAVIEIVDDEEYVESVAIQLRPGDRLEIRAAQGRSPLIRLLDLHANRQDSWLIEGINQDGLPNDDDGSIATADDEATEPTGSNDDEDLSDADQEAGQGGHERASRTDHDEADADDGSRDHLPERPIPDPCRDEPCDDPLHPSSPPRLVLDGLTIAGRSVRISGEVGMVVIRHSTLVPGWWLDGDCRPTDEAEPSLELDDLCGAVAISHSIVGSIVVARSEVMADPMTISISDSIVDATRHDLDAISGIGDQPAHAALTIRTTTVIGAVRVHAIELGENSIFVDKVWTTRRQLGCIRYSYVPTGSRTPRRYRCQPDLVRAAAMAATTPGPERDEGLVVEELRVRPRFNSIRYRRPEYGQLAEQCAAEISAGAGDGSEMGAFHDLYQPIRVANLQAGLDEYTPAGSDAGIVFVT